MKRFIIYVFVLFLTVIFPLQMNLSDKTLADWVLRIIFPVIIIFGIYKLLKYKLYIAEISFILMWIGLEMVAKPKYELFGRTILAITLLAGPLLILKLLDEIRTKSIKDHLTGLYTRSYFFDEWLPAEVSRQSRKKDGKIAFLFLDVDNMKKINDKHGHAVGDRVLSHIARIVKSSIRKSDIAVRMGGDEILVAFPETDGQMALKIAERIAENISKCRYKDLDVSISFGLAIWRKGKDVEKVISLADRKMYEMKKSKNFRFYSLHS